MIITISFGIIMKTAWGSELETKWIKPQNELTGMKQMNRKDQEQNSTENQGRSINLQRLKNCQTIGIASNGKEKS